ncbi:MAG: protoheme IX farnesyltransferase, partial [Myxococcota bacterium]
MSAATESQTRGGLGSMLDDLVQLTKPGILTLSVLMAALGIWLAPTTVPATTVWLALLGTGLLVGSANALNMVLERDLDGLMARTKNRPLPAGRMRPGLALAWGASLGLLGTAVLWTRVNGLTASLGVLSLANYVMVYTPMKRRTPLALQVGAVSGAMPPLMGWTTVNDTLDAPGLWLFAVLFVW